MSYKSYSINNNEQNIIIYKDNYFQHTVVMEWKWVKITKMYNVP
jgi:hypothetical protein